DLIVFGKLAGTGAAHYVNSLSTTPAADDAQIEQVFARAREPLMRESGDNPYVIHEELQDTMGEYVGIVRTGEELEQGIEKLGELKSKVANVKAHGASQYNPGWHEALSLQSLMVTSEAVARAALIREESRGAHTRLDFEGERDEWVGCNIVIRKGNDGEMEVEKIDRPAGPE